MFKNTIFIILNARLKTLDTIIPLMMELDQSKTEIYYYSPNNDTTKSIKLNYVLNDAIKKTGTLIYFYKNTDVHKYKSLIKNSFKFISFSLYFLFKIMFNKLDIIYFSDQRGKKSLLKFLRYNVFLCENDPFGHTKYILKTKKIEEEILLGKKIISSEFILPKQNLILFSENFYNLDINKNNKKINFWTFSNIKLGKKWLSFLDSNKKEYLKKEFDKNNIEFRNKIITICLGPLTKEFGWDKDGKVMRELISETLETINSLNLNFPIFIKPYPLGKDNENFLNEQMLYEILKKNKITNYIITYLHPMILAQHSIFMIANSNTSTFADFKFFSVPTIEYTHYSDLLLKNTNGKSIRPDWATYFINHDKNKLIESLKKIIYNLDTKSANSNISYINDQNNTLLVDRLNGNKQQKIKSFNEIKRFLI